MTAGVSFAQRYRERWLRNVESGSLDRVLAENIFERSWHKPSDLPNVPITEELSCGYLCALAGDSSRAPLFLRRAADFAARRISESRYLDTDVAVAGHPQLLAKIVRGRAHARFLLGEGLDRTAFRQAAGDFAEWCLTKANDRGSFDDSGTMCFYLAGVRAAIIACDLDYAGELLRKRTTFRWHHAREYALWRELVESYPDLSDAFDQKFEAFFDVVRDPDFKDADEIGPVFVEREPLALDTGIIRETYVINASPHDDPDPARVIEAIAR